MPGQETLSSLKIACACVHLGDRLINKQSKWPSYLEMVTGLRYTDFVTVAQKVAQIYVDWYNTYNFKLKGPGLGPLERKFSSSAYHKVIELKHK